MSDFFVFLWYNIYFYDNLFVTPVFIYIMVLNVYLKVYLECILAFPPSTLSEAYTLIR